MDVHSLHLIIVFALVILVFVAFLREWLAPDVVALSALGILLITGTIQAEDALKVFSNSAPITIGCMFVLSAALERTGAIDALARIFCGWRNERGARSSCSRPDRAAVGLHCARISRISASPLATRCRCRDQRMVFTD